MTAPIAVAFVAVFVVAGAGREAPFFMLASSNEWDATDKAAAVSLEIEIRDRRVRPPGVPRRHQHRPRKLGQALDKQRLLGGSRTRQQHTDDDDRTSRDGS